jgi:hypothetical protein
MSTTQNVLNVDNVAKFVRAHDGIQCRIVDEVTVVVIVPTIDVRTGETGTLEEVCHTFSAVKAALGY